MEKKRAGSDRRSQSAVMYLVMAFSFCIFIWLLGTVKAPDVRFDSEKPVVITGDWSMEYFSAKGDSGPLFHNAW